jgi:hypothetical protein
MNEQQTEAQRKARLRWVTLGEAIAIAALIISAAGLWLSWRTTGDDKGPTELVEKRQSVPLALRGKTEDDGRTLAISPVEDGHALQSLDVTVAGSSAIEAGSDGQLDASDLESALGDKAEDGKGTHRIRVRIATKYVEAGADKSATGSYVISYRWEGDGLLGGGLLGGRSLRFSEFTRG